MRREFDRMPPTGMPAHDRAVALIHQVIGDNEALMRGEHHAQQRAEAERVKSNRASAGAAEIVILLIAAVAIPFAILMARGGA
jgi:hypothetical protein